MLKSIELSGFKSFAKKTEFQFPERISAIVGPNGSGKSNTAEAFRFALGEQSMKSLRGKKSDDLLFNGSSGVPRANRAGVRVTFDNSSQPFSLDFDEVVIERIIHRDASHDYRINDSNVRLRDVQELLARANIGVRGHHIISQGEADRILSVKPHERKEMIEDALGLKIYHFKKRESSKKLQKTKENLDEIVGLLREITPRLKHLGRHMRRIEKARELKVKLTKDSRLYFASIEKTESEKINRLKKEREGFSAELEECRSKLSSLQNTSINKEEVEEKRKVIVELEQKKEELSQEIQKSERERGRLQGQLDILERRLSSKKDDMIHISVSDFAGFVDTLLSLAEKYTSSDLRDRAKALLQDYVKDGKEDEFDDNREDIQKELKRYEDIISTKSEEKSEAQKKLEDARKDFEALTSKEEHERKLIDLKDKERDISASISRVEYEIRSSEEKLSNLKEDVVDAGLSFGRDVLSYTDLLNAEDFSPLDVSDMREIKKDIERGKVKIEEANLREAKEIEFEYREVKERSDFLEKEIEDLSVTKDSLTSLIKNLDEELHERFKEGLVKINDEFDRFFSIMFGGGSASLVVVNGNEEDDEQGVEIDVELPRKRVRGLTMLSGGERSLTSIALIFAISQINPPPFIILDETDAALDEANSKRYGDLIESLSEKSQLILITHNRETMARAGALYGVTMGSDGVSRVLSVKFEDAQMHAAR